MTLSFKQMAKYTVTDIITLRFRDSLLSWQNTYVFLAFSEDSLFSDSLFINSNGSIPNRQPIVTPTPRPCKTFKIKQSISYL